MNTQLNLKQIRAIAKLSQKQLAEKWGVSIQTVFNYENNKTTIPVDRFLDLCAMAHIDPKLYSK